MTGFDNREGLSVGRYMQMSIRETEELRVVGRAAAAPHLSSPERGVRTGAVLTMIDSVGGVNGGLAALPEGWVVSTNLSARVLAPVRTGPIRIESNVLRRGRNNVVTAVQLRDEGARDAIVASGVLTSAILVPENGPPQWERPLAIEWSVAGGTSTRSPSATSCLSPATVIVPLPLTTM